MEASVADLLLPTQENVAKKIRDLYQEKKPEDMHLIPQVGCPVQCRLLSPA